MTEGPAKPIVDADPADPAQEAAVTHEVEGRDPEAQSLERAAPEGGMRVQRVVERAHEQDAGLLEMIRHQPVGSVASVHHLRHHTPPPNRPGRANVAKVVTRVATRHRPRGSRRPGIADRAAGGRARRRDTARRGSLAAPRGPRRAPRSRRRPAPWRAGGRSPAPSGPASADRSPAGPGARSRCRVRWSPRRGSGSADPAAARGRSRSAAAVHPRGGCRARPGRSRILPAAGG